jgi:hypothetical protein
MTLPDRDNLPNLGSMETIGFSSGTYCNFAVALVPRRGTVSQNYIGFAGRVFRRFHDLHGHRPGRTLAPAGRDRVLGGVLQA